MYRKNVFSNNLQTSHPKTATMQGHKKNGQKGAFAPSVRRMKTRLRASSHATPSD